MIHITILPHALYNSIHMHFTTPSYQNSKMLLKKTINQSISITYSYQNFVGMIFNSFRMIMALHIHVSAIAVQAYRVNRWFKKLLLQFSRLEVICISIVQIRTIGNLHILICFYWQIAIFRQRSWVLIRSQYSFRIWNTTSWLCCFLHVTFFFSKLLILKEF